MPKTTEHDDTRRGLGKLVYSVDAEETLDDRREAAHESAEVTEASKESFPASDPPAYTGVAADPPEEDTASPRP